jgi:NADP-dependent 3-hydroxy acid dehydrogenase YdfG
MVRAYIYAQQSSSTYQFGWLTEPFFRLIEFHNRRGPYAEWQLLQPQDVADAVIYASTAPPHVAVNEILIEPRDQA